MSVFVDTPTHVCWHIYKSTPLYSVVSVRWLVGWSVTQIFDDPPGAPFVLLGLVFTAFGLFFALNVSIYVHNRWLVICSGKTTFAFTKVSDLRPLSI